MWKGTSPSGEHYYPAFPYTSYQRMRLEDVRDLFAYLKTLPPVQGKVRDHDLPIYFKFRRMLGGWKFLFLDGQQFKPDPSKPKQWNRGAYLVNAPSHCAECHSPRNVLGAIIARQRFAGGPDPEGGDGWVPNITQAGIGDYSERDIERVLETGDMPNGDSVGGAMTSVVANISQLPAADRAAIAAYVKSLPPVEGPKPTKK
jgi:mono/diheme cytochrome c family protein